jgi:NADH-dependent peroxiredoxin subunit C
MSCSNCSCKSGSSISTPTVGAPAIDFKIKGFWKGEIRDFSLTDYRGKWVVLFFYPGDFTFVCPTELEDLAYQYDVLQKSGVEVLAISTDSAYVHSAWKEQSEALSRVEFPLLSDRAHTVSKQYGVLKVEEGMSARGTFVIDAAGIVRAIEIHDSSIGRNAKELVRKVQAAQYVDTHPGNVCPAAWQPGDDTLVPSIDLVGKI